MNRFRNKKKNKEEAVAAAAAALSAAPAAPPSTSNSTRPSTEEGHSFMGFRRNKKAPEEVKETEIDLANALPATDDFRTSLLMTGLSARFSMLREQDDPSTKIGKALDDSVLFGGGDSSSSAKRQSRMNMAGEFNSAFRGLGDIAEVESLRGMRPPPALLLRTHSFGSETDSLGGEGSGGGSIMNRTRPTDGNVMFGGRQKIYRIPAGAASSSKSLADGGMGGRALYDDDVALSAFQKLRQEKKQREEEEENDDDTTNNNETTRSESPSPIDFNLRRETSSTTSSGGARNSTAATSVVSQPGGLVSSLAKEWQTSASDSSKPETSAPERNNTTTRIRRLYEQGLTQDLHEQQNSALSRMDTLSGKRMLRSMTPDLNASASSSPTPSFGFKENNSASSSPAMGTVTSTLERLERRQAMARSSSTNLRSMSPPMSGSGSGGTISAKGSAEGLSGLSSLAGRNAIGLGLNRKASATSSIAGSLTSRGGPTSPPLSPPMSDAGSRLSGGGGDVAGATSPVIAIQPNDIGKATAMGVFQKPALPYDESRFAQRQLQLQQGRETPTERTRADSNASVPAAAAAAATATATVTATASNRDSSKMQSSFLFDGDDDDDDESNYGDNSEPPTVSPVPVILERPSDADHPAFRSNRDDDAAAATPKPDSTETFAMTTTAPTSSSAQEPVDSPTLGPGGGLSGMVLQHLRSTSVASSVYSRMSHYDDNSSNNNSASTIPMHANSLGFNFGGSAASSINNDNNEAPPTPRVAPPPVPASAPPPVPAPAGESTTWRAPSLRSVSSRSHVTSIAESQRSSAYNTDNDKDTNNDDDDFASQLANARRRVQKRLTTHVASADSSRANSPQLAAHDGPMPVPPPLPPLSEASASASSTPAKASPVGMLRTRTSRGTLFERGRDVPFSMPPMRSPSHPPVAPTSHPSASRTSTDVDDTVDDNESRKSTDDNTTTTAADGPVHPGLLAFRNARRQLQKRKELALQAKHGDAEQQQSAATPPVSLPSSPAHSRSPPRQRRPTASAKPQQPMQRDASMESRDRSGSEASSSNGHNNGGRHTPPRLARVKDQARYNERSQPNSPIAAITTSGLGPNPSNHSHSHLSPISPATSGRPGGMPPTRPNRSPQFAPPGYPNIGVQTAMGGSSNNNNGYPGATSPLPVSPLSGSTGLPGNNNNDRSGASTPNGTSRMMPHQHQHQRPNGTSGYSAPAPPATLNDSMKRSVRKNEISEPTFVMSTSRVPTMSLANGGSGTSSSARSRSSSRAAPSGPSGQSGPSGSGNGAFVPPLPPINPLRKQSGSRGMLSGLRRTKTDTVGDEMDTMSALTIPTLTSSASTSNLTGNRSGGGGDADDRRPRLRERASEASGMHARLMQQQRMDLPGGMI